MIHKFVEILDEGTFIPALAIRLESDSEKEMYLLRRCGFGDTPTAVKGFIVLIKLGSMECQWDSNQWNNRTMKTAHKYLEANWGLLESGAVIDVQYLLHETMSPKLSESFIGSLKTPAEWSELKDIVILDPDGWRKDGKSMDEPLSLAEFEERAGISTVKGKAHHAPSGNREDSARH